MNPMTAFQFHNTSVRVFPTEDGQSFWVVAKDVADVLGYLEAKDLARQVPDKFRGRQMVPTPGGEQEMLVIYEPGLYRAVLRSNKPEAEPFMDWLTEDVLPAIRKTGSYARPGAADQAGAFNLALAQELGKMRDQMVLLTGQVVDVYRLLDSSRIGHLRAESKITRLLDQERRRLIAQEKREAVETMLRMEAAGCPRADIVRATGRTLNHVRQVIHQARRDGLLPVAEGAQMDLALTAG